MKLNRGRNYSKRSLDHILESPLTPIRIEVAESFRKKDISLEGFELFLGHLQETVGKQDKRELRELNSEIENVRAAIATGEAPEKPNIDMPSTQLLWGTTLALLQHNPDLRKKWDESDRVKPLINAPVWSQIKESPRADMEQRSHAYHLDASGIIRDRQIRLRWGKPESWFYFAPKQPNVPDSEQNLVNIDLVWSLITGFEHVRSITFHEIGHSQLTTKWTPSMQKIRDEMDPIIEKIQNEGVKVLTDEEKEKLPMLAVEWQLRHQIQNAAEDNCVNRFAANRSKWAAQDYGVSLNHAITIVTGIAKAAQDGQNKTDFEKSMDRAIKKITSIVDKDSDARRRFSNLGHAINMSFFQNNGLFADSEEGWQKVGVKRELIEALPREDGEEISSEQAFAELREMCGGKEGIEHLQPTTRERMDKRHFVETVDEYADRRIALIEEIWDRYAAPLAAKIKDEVNESMGKGSGDGQGEEQESSSGNGVPDLTDIDTPPENPQENHNSADGHDSRKPKKEEEPEEGKTAGGDNEEDKDAGKTIDELLDERNEDQRKDQDERKVQDDPSGDNSRRDQNDPIELENVQEHQSTSVGEVKFGELNEYRRRVARNEPTIRRVSSIIQKIQEQQMELELLRSPDEFTLLPEDDDISRFDLEREYELRQKRATGQKIEEGDFNRCVKDHEFEKFTTSDWIIIVDDSGSMRPEKLKKAIDAGVIVYEAAKRRNEEIGVQNVNVYFGVMGNSNFLILGQPGDDDVKVSKAIEGILQNECGCEALYPALTDMTKILIDRSDDEQAKAGYSHFLVVTDGAIHDMEQAKLAAEALFKNCSQVTMDCLIVSSSQDTRLEQFAGQIQTRNPDQKVGIVKATTDEEVKQGIINLLTKRYKKMPPTMAVDAEEKRESLKRAYRGMI